MRGTERALLILVVLFATATLMAVPAAAQPKPNIVVIMGDDIGIWNIGAYHRGMMAGRTPNLDKIAAEGMLFTDYYAEASCTAGRANFITGELPIRTGMTTVGQAGAPIGLPAEARDHRHGAQVAWATPPASSARTTSATSTSSCRRCTASTSSSATSITSTRWRTRAIPNYPQDLLDTGRPAQHGPLAGRPTSTTPTVIRAGARSASRRSRTPARSIPKRMETVDDEIRDLSLQVHRQGQGRRQAVLPLAQPDAHAHRHAPVAEVRGDAQLEERLVHPRSRHGAARRRSSAR